MKSRFARICGVAAVAVSSLFVASLQAATGQSNEVAHGSTPLIDGPSTFEGTLPCADCPGIRYQLNLQPDHTYSSRMVYEERNTHYDESGTWTLDGKVLTLHSKAGGTQKYAVRDVETLRQLDTNGKEIESKLNYDLKRARMFVPLAGGGEANAKLEDTQWTLIELQGAAVHPGPKEAFLQLDAASHRMSGSGGCNRVMGSYEIKGDQLKFGPTAGTRMACAQGMETEDAFLQMLSLVSTWKIVSGKLELFDASGKLLARFETHGK